MKTKTWITQISKHIFYLLLTAGLLCSCSPPDPYCGKWKLYVKTGSQHTLIVCDSLQMKSDTSAVVWIDGIKTNIHANRVTPSFQPCR